MGLDFLGPVGLGMIGFEAVKAIYDAFDVSGARAVETAQKSIEADMRQLETLRERERTMKSTFATYQKNLEVLSALSKEERLTNSGRKAAIEIIESLKKANIDLGAVYDENTGKLTLAADAQNRLNEKQKQAAKANLELQLKTEQALAKDLSAKMKAEFAREDVSWQDYLLGRYGEKEDIKNANLEAISAQQDAVLARVKYIKDQLASENEKSSELETKKTSELAKQEIQLKEK